MGHAGKPLIGRCKADTLHGFWVIVILADFAPAPGGGAASNLVVQI